MRPGFLLALALALSARVCTNNALAFIAQRASMAYRFELISFARECPQYSERLTRAALSRRSAISPVSPGERYFNASRTAIYRCRVVKYGGAYTRPRAEEGREGRWGGG